MNLLFPLPKFVLSMQVPWEKKQGVTWTRNQVSVVKSHGQWWILEVLFLKDQKTTITYCGEGTNTAQLHLRCFLYITIQQIHQFNFFWTEQCLICCCSWENVSKFSGTQSPHVDQSHGFRVLGFHPILTTHMWQENHHRNNLSEYTDVNKMCPIINTKKNLFRKNLLTETIFHRKWLWQKSLGQFAGWTCLHNVSSLTSVKSSPFRTPQQSELISQ